MPGGCVALNTAFVGEETIPTERGLTTPNQYEEIPFPFRMKTGAEGCIGGWVACPAGNEQYPAKYLDRVLGQVGLSEECGSCLVVTNDVPPVQSVFISQMRDELRDRHASPSPWYDTVRIDLEHVGNQTPHSLFFNVEAKKKIVMFHGSERGLALFKGTGLRNRVPLQERIEMPIDLHRNTRDVCGDLMGCPSLT